MLDWQQVRVGDVVMPFGRFDNAWKIRYIDPINRRVDLEHATLLVSAGGGLVRENDFPMGAFYPNVSVHMTWKQFKRKRNKWRARRRSQNS